ncbi:response regulator [Brevibacillus brevis]|uniref:Response regulator n=1 Tax=Brevibacillus brevis TaxID=1393 RepID=A0ABY9TAK0_BREBE|nr:response regulator [Brevibacillus brevis]WNC16206.1 response regulator [Brevibacillus brevis]
MSNLRAAFQQRLSQLEANRTSCGVILAACSNFSKEELEAMRKHFEQSAPAITTHYAFDGTGIVGVLLEQQKLGDTHFHALLVKEYLLDRRLLSGSLLIASFPDGARDTGQTLMKMTQDIRQLERLGEIHIYDREREQASILLVNPDETVNEFLSIYLQRKGYRVIVASDGMEGVQKYQEVGPDLVITDLNLPVINGYQLMERIKHAGSERYSKIVVLTDKRLEEDVQKSFALGASDYITKPFSPVELEARVKRLIS